MDDLLARCNQSVKLAPLVAKTGWSVDQCRPDFGGVGQRLADAFSSRSRVEEPRRGNVPLVLRIDGGGTKRVAVIPDQNGRVLGRGVGGP
jgi:N-acetylmuramic acid 6-phosphate etherase